ncbi:MAG: type II toxin-antitoxin system HipA family toxin [Bacteroidota bacterium]
MVTTAIIKIWGQIVGAVAWDDNQKIASFEYDPSFVRNGWELSPLKMPLPSGKRVYSFPELRKRQDSEYDTFKGLPGLLADALPDRYGNRLIDAWLAQNGRSGNSMNPVEQLCFIGTRGMGALEFEPAQFKQDKSTFRLEVDSLVSIARKMLQDRDRFATALGKDEEQAVREILKIGTSAGGARPKALIAYNEKTGDVRSGQTNAPKGYEHWLMKLDRVSDAQFGESSGWGRIEYAYYLMAKACGINMTPCQLYIENDRAHFMTKRYDRETGNVKHHVQTWCAMVHYDFSEVTSFSYEQLFQTMREIRLPYPQAEEMFRRMVFNVVAKNCDDHTKNFGFRLKQGGGWELTPAYDVCYAYNPNNTWVRQHALSVNGKRMHISKADLEAVAKSMNIKKGKSIIEQVNATVKQWPNFAEEADVSASKRDQINETLETFR